MDYMNEFSKWLSYDFLDSETKSELAKLKNNEEKIKECFYDYVPFGTAGMRGLMGVGTNRLNIYTIRRASQGLSDFIISKNKQKDGVAIIYDCRINSEKFALEAALNFAANGIKAYISKSLRPTPFLSYAVRNLHTFAGVNITASHNGKEYNGYKLYLADGAQFSYPDDEQIIKLVNKIDDLSQCKTMSKAEAIKKKLLVYMDDKLDKQFLNDSLDKIINKKFVKNNGKKLKVVYTPLHGTGSVFLKDAMKQAGFTNVTIVKSQDDKNGEFKTVTYPNPESKAAFEEALKIAVKKDADIVVATDPDADRLGTYIRVAKGKYLPLTGNELSSIILEYILYFAKVNKKNLSKCYAVKSFVTTRLIDAICKRYGVELKTTLTGFKWIGKEILHNKKEFIFGAEESYGFLVSDYVRDKDAVSATLLTLEIALAFKTAGYTLIDALNMMKDYYGVYKNYNYNLDFPGISGLDKMKNIMASLRAKTLDKITDIAVEYFDDYDTSLSINVLNNTKSHIDLPKNNSIVIKLIDSSVITIRPSGTEPKIKIYFDILDQSEELADNKYNILCNAMCKILDTERI